MAEEAQRRQHALDRADQSIRRRFGLVGVGLAQRQQVGQKLQNGNRVARDVAAIGQDLPVQLLGEVAGGAAQHGRRRGQGECCKGERDARAQLLLAVGHFVGHGAQIADLQRQRLQVAAVEGKLGTLQHHRGMLQPGDDAARGDRRLPGDAGNAAAIGGNPVADQRTGIGGGKLGAGGAHVAQPAKAMQRALPVAVGHFDLERRLAAGLDQMAGKGVAAVVDFKRDLLVGKPQVRRRDQNAFWRATGETPAIERTGAQAAAGLAPELPGDQRPKACRVACRNRQLVPPE